MSTTPAVQSGKTCAACKRLILSCWCSDPPEAKQRLPQAVESVTWAPIATAPKMRTVLVAYRNELGKWRRVRATFYEAGQLMCDDNVEPPECDENGYAAPGWYEECESAEYINPVAGEPELWIHLPELPL